MKKDNRTIYVIINTNTFDVRVTPYKQKVAEIIEISRNTLTSLTKRTTIKGFIIIPVTEE